MVRLPSVKRGRPPKPAEAVKTIHLGLKVTEQEYALLAGIVASENMRLAQDGYEQTATTASMVRKLLKEEAKRRGLVREVTITDPDAEKQAASELVPLPDPPTKTGDQRRYREKVAMAATAPKRRRTPG